MRTEAADRNSGLAIAIVGMTARLPGARDLEEFWKLLADGNEGIRRLSDAELRAAGLSEERLRDPDLIRGLGLIDDGELFDAGFFGYSSSDAEILDPQQRIFLEQCWMALESAGYSPEKFNGAIGLFAGCGLSAYTTRLVASGWVARSGIGFQKIVGNDKDHLTTAVAYKLGLTGPAVTVQTTCSTSLVAVHMACRSLLGRECDVALAGGVTAGLEFGSAPTYQEGNILSRDGHCRPFDAQASGTVVSNGAAVVVLRRLEDALRDGDNIRAVIRATAVNNDGSLKVGYMSPSVAGQFKVVRRALRLADVHPETVDYVEAHGTGTLKGDPIEVRALARAYREQTARSGYCALGSVKANIGHPDTAAGAAGLIKTVLAMQHGVIPPTPHFTTPNPELELENSPFFVNNTAIPWPRAARPRRAAVSSFGLGGTNAHLILEQAPEVPHAAPDDEPQLLLISGKTPTALAASCRGLAGYLRKNSQLALRDVAFTLRYGRADLKERAWFVGSRVQILEQLEAGSDCAAGSASRWLQQARDYYRSSAAFRELVAQNAKRYAAGQIEIEKLLQSATQDGAGLRDLAVSVGDPDAGQALQLALSVMGELWRRGQVQAVAAPPGMAEGQRIELPHYPFERSRYWIDTAESPRPSRDSAPVATDVSGWLYVPVWRQCAAGPSNGRPETPEKVVIFAAPGDEVAQACAAHLKALDEPVTVFVQYPSVVHNPSVVHKRSVAHDGNEYAGLLAQWNPTRDGMNRFVFFDSYLESLSPNESADGPGYWFAAPMLLAQALGERALNSGGGWPSVSLTVVSKGMWSLDGEEACFPRKALARGLGIVLSQEYPGLRFRSIDLPNTGYEAFATGTKHRTLIEEIRCDAPPAHVALRGRSRWERVFAPVKNPQGGREALKQNGVYLITGGLGGIGLEIAEYLARHQQARLVLVARHVPDAIEDRLQRIRELGGEIHVVRADVTSAAAMSRAKSDAESRFGAIDGIIHAAGSMPGSIVQRMSEESAWEVMKAKVQGARVLTEVFGDRPRDFILFFSSLRALAGGAGNADYAAANAYLDAVALDAWTRGRTDIKSVNWDGWAGVGMSLKAKKAPGQEADPAPLSVEQGLRALTLALGIENPQVIVSSTDVGNLVTAMATSASVPGLPALKGDESGPSEVRPRPANLEQPYVAPRSDTEALLARIWEQALGVSPIGVRDSFLALGGDSVTSLQVAAKATGAGIRIGPFDTLERDSIAEVCEHLQAQPAEVKDDAGAEVTGDVPLTPIQHWFFDRTLHNSSHFNQAFVLKSARRLDPTLLEQALQHILKHHDALRSRFFHDERSWRQQQVPYSPRIVLRVEDLRDCQPQDREARMRESCGREQTTLDLENAVVIKAVFFDCGDHDADRLMICAHHLVVDVISWRVLLGDVETAYGQLSRGEPVHLGAKSTSYKRWADSLHSYADSPAAGATRQYWAQVLSAGLRELPRDLPDGQNTVASTDTISREIDLGDLPVAARDGVTPLAVFLAAIGTAFSEWVGPGGMLVCLEGHGRDGGQRGLDVSRTVGWFTTMYPFAIPQPADSDLTDAAAVQDALDAIPNHGLDYGVLAYLCDDLIRYAAQPEVLVLYLGQAGQGHPQERLFTMAGESAGWTEDPANHRPHTLEIIGSIVGSRLNVSVAFSAQLHRRATIEGFLDALVRAYEASSLRLPRTIGAAVDVGSLA